MDAHEVEREHKGDKQGVVHHGLDLLAIFVADGLDSVGRCGGGRGDETCDELALGGSLGDDVIGVLPSACMGISGETV